MARRSPFGPERLENEETSFRLWAPSADGPVLVLGDRRIPMERVGDGFWEAAVEGVEAGSAYSFEVGGQAVPDPASRLQADDVHGPSVVTDPDAYAWHADDWAAPPWREAVIYECHVGTFTPEGTYAAAEGKLDHLRGAGINTLELMPLAQFSGRRGWGYDGVLPYAPHKAYGTPGELRHLIDACHAKGMAVMIDVVYNHFGPDGNYLHLYAEDFFDEQQHTPWGAALDFSKQPVRDFFIDNAIMWLRDYRFDGIRFDAVHAIVSPEGREPFLEEMSRRIRDALRGRDPYLVLENDNNAASLIGNGRPYTAQWNDDIHHILHRIATGETDGYYGDYEDAPVRRLARALSEGFDYQGEPSAHRGGAKRGEPSSGIEPSAFVSFIQNHDQVGNRAEGERISDAAPREAVEAITAAYLLAPQVPMLWMGEEWAATSRFPFFCDFHGELADAVREGRRKEFAQFKRFADPEARKAIPDPNDPATFEGAKLDWSEPGRGHHRERLDFVTRLIDLRRRHVVPLLASGFEGADAMSDGDAFSVRWNFSEGHLILAGQLGERAGEVELPGGNRIFELRAGAHELRPWSIVVSVGS